MSRKKNILNEKNRLFSCSATSTIVTYKLQLKEEASLLGHYIESSVINGELVLKFATKNQSEPPAFYIEKFEVPQLLSFF